MDTILPKEAVAATPVEHVDALNGVFGPQGRGRAVHAKGIVLTGRFVPTAEGASVSRAPHFQGPGVAVTARFSNFAGLLDIPDTHPLASPSGLAVRFHLAGGGVTDLVTHSFNGFPAETADEFRRLMLAVAVSGPGAATPTALDRYLESHPIARHFLTTQAPPPVSFATLAYFGVNAFRFTNSAGTAQFGRCVLDPEAGLQSLTGAQISGADSDYLRTEIRRRVAAGPVRFRMRVQLAEPGDVIDNPAVPWPADRRTVEVGTLLLERVDADSEATERRLVFGPGLLVDGIEAADPMIDLRHRTYRVSFERRGGV